MCSSTYRDPGHPSERIIILLSHAGPKIAIAIQE
jgi:hypothetical protein